MVILDVGHGKELRAHVADVWQGKSLGKSSIDSKGFMAVLLGACLEVQIPKELAYLLIESKGVAGAFAFDNAEDWSDFPEVWQPQGLESEGRELGEGALSGQPYRLPLPPHLPHLY